MAAAPVRIRTFINETEADAAVQALRAEGIECQIIADDCGGMIPTLQQGKGIRLFVSQADADRADALLTELGSVPPPSSPPA